MSEVFGFLAAMVSMVAWGSYLVPMKALRKYDPIFFQAIMVTGIFAASLGFILFFGNFVLSSFGLIAGVMWVIGNILSILAVKTTGLARTAPVWMSTIMVVSFLWGLFFFQEVLTSVIFGILGIALLILGANVVSFSRSGKEKFKMKGVIFAAIAGVILGTYIVPFQLSGLGATDFIFSMTLGMFVAAWGMFLFKRSKFDKKVFSYGLFSGFIWNFGNIGSLFAVALLGLSVGFPLTQTALLVAVSWGLFYFKEVKKKSKIIQIMIGAAILIIGAFLLGFSK